MHLLKPVERDTVPYYTPVNNSVLVALEHSALPQRQCPEKLLDLLLGGEPVLTCTQIYDAQIDKRQNLIFEAIYNVGRSYLHHCTVRA